MVVRAALLVTTAFAFAASAETRSLLDVVKWTRYSVNHIHLLLDEGADPNPRDEDGQTPSRLAAGRRHIEVARLLRGRSK